jgi:hypothetical protein
MFFILSSRQQDQFLNLPETGMGYQIVEAQLAKSYSRSRYILLNAEVAVALDGNERFEIRTIIYEGLREIRVSAPTKELTNINLLNEVQFRTSVSETKSSNGGAIRNASQRATGTERLARLSAFFEDKRIDTTRNCLRPGSFTTSVEDYLNCKNTNEEPNELYALPNGEKIEWIFYINPIAGDSYQRGIVEPVNNRRGGGEEYYFELGTSANTYAPPAKPY